MPSSFATGRGAPLVRSPSRHQQAARRRLAVISALLALAVSSAVVGSLVRPERPPKAAPANGPFSYFPSQ